MKNWLLISILALAIFSCKKEDPELPCEEENFGALEVTNTRGEAYDFYLAGAFQRKIEAGEVVSFTKVPAFNLAWEARESSWIISQDIRQGNVEVLQCKYVEMDF